MKNKTILGLLLVIIGVITMLFGIWQKDLLCEPFMNRSTQDRIDFYTGLQKNGYNRVWDFPFTINVELFPHMTAGEMYDLIDIMIAASSIPIGLGAFLLNQPVTIIYMKAKNKLKGVKP